MTNEITVDDLTAPEISDRGLEILADCRPGSDSKNRRNRHQ